jgi:hypothetical protein
MVRVQFLLSLDTTTDKQTANKHVIGSWKYSEQARSRAFLDLLGTSFIKTPDSIPDTLHNKETSLLWTLRTLGQVDIIDTRGQRHITWEQYYDTYKELRKIWKEMISLDPDTQDYVDLRQGNPAKIKDILELLV